MQSWCVLKTKANRELLVHKQLIARDIDSYLPLWHPSQLGAGAALRPYFPTYLFAKVDLEQTSRSSLMYLPGVNYLLMYDDEPVFVEQAVIDGIAARIYALEKCVRDAAGNPLTRGDRVRITGGVFEGYEAIFDQQLSSGDRVRILIDFLQKRAPLTLERTLIQKKGQANLTAR